MSILDEAHAEFEKVLDASWSATADLVYDNVKDIYTPKKNISWARFTINWLASENMALGTKTTRNGIATMQIFTPANQGPRVAAKIADAYFDLLENKVLGNTIFTYAGSAVRLGAGDNGWYQLNADINFQAT